MVDWVAVLISFMVAMTESVEVKLVGLAAVGAGGFSWFEQAKKSLFPTQRGPEEAACVPPKWGREVNG